MSATIPLIDLTLSPRPVDPRLPSFSCSNQLQLEQPMDLPLPKWYLASTRSSKQNNNNNNEISILTSLVDIDQHLNQAKLLPDPTFNFLWYMNNRTKLFATTAGGQTTFLRSYK
ncbi:unnamed protein product [Adineta steineri]|uniref:Uncharacterized protein n=1 Tax=Adineta steineri TaxID=433720 RepID=A0A819ZSL6_9BILA|nr:unnamed protein product [Adineta steineri]CAF4176895.1 unnamed protein product [Adineta steineri]